MVTFRRTLFPWVVTALLLLLCLLPKSWFPRNETGPKLFPHLDKVIHFSMFAGFALSWAVAGRTPAPSRSRIRGVLGAAFALAVATELAQGLPQIARDPDALDALADAVGATTSVGMVFVWNSAGRTVRRPTDDEQGATE